MNAIPVVLSLEEQASAQKEFHRILIEDHLKTRSEIFESFTENAELYAAGAWGLIIPFGENRTNAQICADTGRDLIEAYREYLQNLPEYD